MANSEEAAFRSCEIKVKYGGFGVIIDTVFINPVIISLLYFALSTFAVLILEQLILCLYRQTAGEIQNTKYKCPMTSNQQCILYST